MYDTKSQQFPLFEFVHCNFEELQKFISRKILLFSWKRFLEWQPIKTPFEAAASKNTIKRYVNSSRDFILNSVEFWATSKNFVESSIAEVNKSARHNKFGNSFYFKAHGKSIENLKIRSKFLKELQNQLNSHLNPQPRKSQKNRTPIPLTTFE